jgi:hypothetical protein
MRQWTQWLVLAAAVFSLFTVLSGCASGVTEMPQLKTSVTLGPKAHSATINVSASGVGGAFSGIVLTYPDGHRRLLGTATYSDADSGTWGPEELPSGTYTYTIYATPAGPADMGSFPVGRIVKDNIVASGTFVIQ